MNRFLGRRKTGEEEPAVRPSTKDDSSFPYKILGRFRKSQKEPDPEVEVHASLPLTSNGDFRTSIIMNELAARVSLLRERESPTKSSRKARDDSVLYAERRAQITPRKECNSQENERCSPKRPATRSGRIEGRRAETWKGESVMDRVRTTQSNNLFGGRRKLNIIPSSGTRCRALYCDDIAPSAFQNSKQQGKERKAAETKESEHISKDSAKPSFSQDSPQVPSIENQDNGPQRGQSRHKTLGSSRTGTLPTRTWSTGLNNPPERTYSKTAPKVIAPSLRLFPLGGPETPPPMSIEISPTVPDSKEAQPNLPTPPLSATVCDLNIESLRVKNNHKTAALGLQPRPDVKYDEEEYVRRQRQMQNRTATANPILGSDTNKKKINRRSRSFSELHNVRIDRSFSTVGSERKIERELLTRTCFQRTGHGKQSAIDNSRFDSRQRSDSAAAASPESGRSFSRVHHLAISPPPRMPNETCVNGVVRPKTTPSWSHLSKPRAALGKLDTNLSQESYAALSENEHGLQESAVQPHESDNLRPTVLNASQSWRLKDDDWDAMFVTPLETPPTDAPRPGANCTRGSDDFSRHLSDGVKRIRERMTMHAEAYHSCPPSPELPTGDGLDLPPARPGVFNSLRSKTSHGTLISKRLLSGSSASSVAVSISYESSSKSVVRGPSGPKSAATQSFLPPHSKT